MLSCVRVVRVLIEGLILIFCYGVVVSVVMSLVYAPILLGQPIQNVQKTVLFSTRNVTAERWDNIGCLV
jgi:hypothetical protein